MEKIIQRKCLIISENCREMQKRVHIYNDNEKYKVEKYLNY